MKGFTRNVVPQMTGMLSRQIDGDGAGEQQVHRQRHEADRQSRAEGVGHAAPVQRPQLRVGDALAERPQEPALPQGVRGRA